MSQQAFGIRLHHDTNLIDREAGAAQPFRVKAQAFGRRRRFGLAQIGGKHSTRDAGIDDGALDGFERNASAEVGGRDKAPLKEDIAVCGELLLRFARMIRRSPLGMRDKDLRYAQTLRGINEGESFFGAQMTRTEDTFARRHRAEDLSHNRQ